MISYAGYRSVLAANESHVSKIVPSYAHDLGNIVPILAGWASKISLRLRICDERSNGRGGPRTHLCVPSS
eukprot:scaffold265848_cov13-Prasinocladus_malaysianus.AAC.1